MQDKPMQDKKDQSRRRILKMLVASGSAVTTTRIMPDQWKSPVVDAITVPVHARLSVIEGLFDTGPGSIDPILSSSDDIDETRVDDTRVVDNQWDDADSSVLDYFLSPANAQDFIVKPVPICSNAFSSVQISIGIPNNPGPGQVCIEADCGTFQGATSVNGESLTNTFVGPYSLSNMQLSGGSILGNIGINSSKIPCTASFSAPLIPGMFQCKPFNSNCTVSVELSDSEIA